MKTLKEYARMDEAVDVSIAGLKKLCTSIKSKCRDYEGVQKSKKDINTALEVAEDLCDDDSSLCREAYSLLEDMIEHVWDSTTGRISNVQRVEAYWKEFSRTVSWLIPVIRKIYE